MYRINILNVKKLMLTLVVLCFCSQLKAQNEQIAIEPINGQEFRVKSLNGIPFTVVLEESNNDGQFHMGVNTLTFKTADMIGERSTLRIVFDREIYLSLENKIVEEYQADVKWIESKLQITEGEFEIFPSRPVFTDQGLEKLKAKVFEYTTSESKERDFNKWIDKINYSVGAMRFFKELYEASTGKKNEQSHNFEPINIHDELQKYK